MDTRQGRCRRCRVAFRWWFKRGKRRLPRALHLAYCPRCGRPLKATTHLYQGEWDEHTLPTFSHSPQPIEGGR